MAYSTALAALFFAWVAPVRAIGVTEGDGSITIDTGSDYGFTTTISTSSCDITSLYFHGAEYQYSGKTSHIASGLGSASVSYDQSGNNVIVTCTASSSDFDLTHYMVFVDGTADIWMATNTNAEPAIGELRYIFRLQTLDTAYPYGGSGYEFGEVSWTADASSTVEGSDVFVVDGDTRSKFYSSERFIDDNVYCATDSGASVHACWVRPDSRATEKSSGGPFFRDIDLNWGGDYHSVTYYMNSNHVQTEAFRQGFHGPYVFSFTRSGIPDPKTYDSSFFEDLGLLGYETKANRGTVTGTASGVSSDFPIVVHWFNDDYQGWAYASADGSFTSPELVAGDYTMVLYQDELSVTTTSVTVTAGSSTTADVAAENVLVTADRTTIFQLGDYDGQPTGFLNADKQLRMHPSDARMGDWAPAGVDAADGAAAFPMAIFKSVNDGQVINFALDAAVAGPATLRLATTLSEAGGRPQASVNGFDCEAPAAPAEIDSRGVTRGAYRGRGDVYECAVPEGTLVAGDNSVTIHVISGSSGDTFLSPSVTFDAIELFY
ncbi:Rhamnogalacturonase B, N-terminal-domain-containing protein [Xylariomycetidae sp. FL0641]|nr:Rhamnogalacturonase B, N-terminal-domain-containing protein [Xylariomycetidae sp. FL0641]